MVALRWKVETQHRYPSVETGFDYYWTNVYYYNNFNSDPHAGVSWNNILDATYGASTYENKLVAIRITNLETNAVHGIATPLVNHGTLPELDGGSLNNVIRLTGIGTDGYASYKMWRPPLQIADFDGDRLSDGMWSVVNDVIIPKLNAATLQNVRGESILAWNADRRVHPWQLRHGTKRRIGPVFAYP